MGVRIGGHGTAYTGGNKPVRLKGVITKVEWTNPHSYFYLDVANAKGQVSNWACEGGGPGSLSRRGWKKADVKIGDTLVVDGFLAKDGSRTIDARRVTLPDGRSSYGGTPGDGGPGDGGAEDAVDDFNELLLQLTQRVPVEGGPRGAEEDDAEAEDEL